MFRISLAEWLKRHPRIRQAAGHLVATLPPSMKMGKQFWYWYAYFRESEQWPIERMREYQFEQVRSLLKKLRETSPYYRNKLDGVDLDVIDSAETLSRSVPSLTRSEFVDNFEDIRSGEASPGKLIRSQTSGTTGKALQFYHAADDYAREWAAICHQWSRVGYEPGKSVRAEFRGLTNSKGLIDVFPERNMIRCSILNLKAEHVRHYAEAARKHRVEFLHGYPSALYLLAATIKSSGISFPQPKAVLLASEEVYDYQLESIQEAFPKSRLFAHYGCAERTVLAGWCEHRREYHVMPQYALVEIDPQTSEIIGTNLYNTVNGFVRYRMTDTVLQANESPCPDCARPYFPRLKSLGGRSEDYLYSREKGLIPPAIVTYPLKNLKVISEIKFVQKMPDEITMLFTIDSEQPGAGLNKELSVIRNGLVELFGAGTSFTFEKVDGFPRSASGKFKWIVNELDHARIDLTGETSS